MGFGRSLANEIIHHKFDYILVILAMVLTGVIRFTPVFDGGFPFLFDHGRDMLEVKNIVVNHHPTLIGPFTGLQGVFQGPLHYYLLAMPFLISEGNPAANIFTMGFLGVLGTLLCYLFGRTMYGRLFGIIVALFFALSPASISFSTIFWNPYWIPFCMIFFMYCMHKALKNPKYLLWCGVISGVIAQFELAFGGNLILVAIILSLFFIKKFYANNYFWYMILLFLLSFSAQILFDLKHEFLMSRSIIQLLEGKNVSLGESIPYPTRLYYRLDEIRKATINTVSGADFFRYLFALIGLAYVFRTMYKLDSLEGKRILFFLACPLWFFAFFLLYPRPAWEWYWVGLQVSYYFFVAYAMSRFMKLHQVNFLVLSALLLIWSVYTYSHYWGHSEVVDTNPGTFRNEIRIIDDIYADSQGKPFGAFVYTPPIYDYNYNYLFWWRGSTKYSYVPNDSKDSLFYLIIEKDDPKNPYGSDGWKKTVIKKGTVKWTRAYPGGVTVERREGAMYKND